MIPKAFCAPFTVLFSLFIILLIYDVTVANLGIQNAFSFKCIYPVDSYNAQGLVELRSLTSRMTFSNNEAVSNLVSRGSRSL